MEEMTFTGAITTVLPRERLTAALRLVTVRKLAIITAPGGYGKSTLIREFAAHLSATAFCWMSLDPADASLPIFLQQLARAAAKHLPPGGLFNLTPEMTPRDMGAVRHLARLMAGELEQHAEERLIIVLDDLHHVAASAAVMTFLDALIQYLPDSVSLILSSRERPPLPVGRRQARGEVIVLSARDLSFTKDEAAAFFRQCLSLDLPPDVLQAVMTQTEGWVTALLLMGNLLKEMPPSQWGTLIKRFVTEGPLFELLAEEVFERQPSKIQAFLLETCLLTSLQPPIIERLLGITGAGAILQELEARNLFLVPTVDGHQTLRYHTVFQAFLQRRLRISRGEGEVTRLNLAAAQGYEGMGNLYEAVEHYLDAGAYTLAIPLMAEQVDNLLKGLRHDSVRRWLHRLPAYLHDDDPGALYLRAQLAGWLAQHDILPGLYQRAIDLYEQRGDFRGMCRCLSWVTNRFWKLRHPYFHEAPARWAVHADPGVAFYGKLLQAFTLTSKGEWSVAFARLESLLNEVPPATRAYFDCLESLAVLGLWIGDLPSVLKHGLMHINGRIAMGDYAWGIYIWVAYSMLGDAAGLESYQRQFTAQEVDPAMLRMHDMVGTLGQGVVHLFHRRWEEALACFESLRPYFNNKSRPYQAMGSEATFVARSEMARIYMRQGRREEARECLQLNLELSAGYPEVTAMAYAYMAEFLADNGDIAGARRHLETALLATPAGLEGPSRITVEVAAHKVAAAAGDQPRARQHLVTAVRIAQGRRCPWYLLHTGGPEVLPAMVALMQDAEVGLDVPGLMQMLGEQARLILAGALGHGDRSVKRAAETVLTLLQYQADTPRVPRLKVYAMGGLRVYHFDQVPDASDWKRNKVKLLFLFLLMRRGKAIAKELLTEALWPEAMPSTARTNLRATLHGLKRSLEPALPAGAESHFVVSDRDTVTLVHLEDIWFDLWELDDALAAARSAKKARCQGEAVKHYERVTALCRGVFLPEIAFADYFQEVRMRTEKAGVAASLEVATARLQVEDYRAAIEFGRRALLLDRTSEEAYQVLIMAYLRRGERDRAMQAYKTCRKHMRQLLGSEPSPRTRALLEG